MAQSLLTIVPLGTSSAVNQHEQPGSHNRTLHPSGCVHLKSPATAEEIATSTRTSEPTIFFTLFIRNVQVKGCQVDARKPCRFNPNSGACTSLEAVGVRVRGRVLELEGTFPEILSRPPPRPGSGPRCGYWRWVPKTLCLLNTRQGPQAASRWYTRCRPPTTEVSSPSDLCSSPTRHQVVAWSERRARLPGVVKADLLSRRSSLLPCGPGSHHSPWERARGPKRLTQAA